MKLQQLACLVVSSMLYCQAVMAAPDAYVLCGKRDGTDSFWVMTANDPNQHLRLNGFWEVNTLSVEGIEYFYLAFQIERKTYNQLITQCEADYAPQPADGYSTEWAVFHILEPNGAITRATGVFNSLAGPGEISQLFFW